MDKNWATWGMGSGEWAHSERGFALTKTSSGCTVSLPPADVVYFYQQPVDQDNPALRFPPEFRFSPDSGKALILPTLSAATGWIPPSGNPAVSGSVAWGVHGLRQTGASLALADPARRSADADPDRELVNPPPGNYFFVSAKFGLQAPALIAIDPFKGQLFAWLPNSARWVPLAAEGPMLEEFDVSVAPSVSLAPESAWRAELLIDTDTSASMLYLPTRAGLACLTLDIASLSYRVVYLGGMPAAGSPIAFGGHLWVPLVDGPRIRFIGVNGDREVAEAELAEVVDTGAIGLPVSSGRAALWLCEKGQLRLRQNDGGVVASWAPWPDRLTPRFEFGSPYCSTDGSLWQICQHQETGLYQYVQIDRATSETPRETTAPRLCSGRANFRFANRQKVHPWEEPPQGDDIGSNEFVLPLVESDDGKQVVGLRFGSEEGIAALFTRAERVPYSLYFDSDSGEMCFHSGTHAQPWRLRLFVHNGHLWAYHPEATRIQGWRLA